MSHVRIRRGGLALTSAVALGCLIHQTGALATQAPALETDQSAVDYPAASIPDVGAASARHHHPGPIALTAAIPALSRLSLPELGATTLSSGYAQRDVVVDLAPDLADRDFSFSLQRRDGDAWVDAATGATFDRDEVGVLAGVAPGTYRVHVPAQYGLQEYTGGPFEHRPRGVVAALDAHGSGAEVRLAGGPSGQESPGSFEFTVERRSGDAWRAVGDHVTKADGSFALKDLPSGAYRIVVADQADALGTASQSIRVTTTRRPPADTGRGSTVASRQPLVLSVASAPGGSAASPGGGSAVGAALGQVGDRYSRGGNGPNAFDCSGLTSYAYRQAGVRLPRTAAEQYRATTRVSSPKAGDLVFFLRGGAEHVGIYIGGGRIVHAATPRRGVEISTFNRGWYAQHFTGYGRVR